MFSTPTTAQLLAAIDRELELTVIPTVSDPKAVVELQMMRGVVASLAVRAENEIAWLRAECDAAAAVGRAVLHRAPAASALAAALEAYESGQTTSLRLSDLQAEYELAGRVLSEATDAAYNSGDAELVASVRAVHEDRLAHELTISADFMAVGRG
jgi:hypothetical protein